MKGSLFILFFTVLFFSCKDNPLPPDRLLQPEKMQEVLWDVLRMQALAAELTKKDTAGLEESRTRALTQQVFRLHHIDSALFHQSYQWYLEHPGTMSKMLDSLNIQKQRARTEGLELKRPVLEE